MTSKLYVYKTPSYAQASMSEPSTLPEFSEEAAKIITHYVRKYRPKTEPNALMELHVRDLLSNEKKLKRQLDPLIRDYLIKVFLRIREPDDEYERNILKISEPTVH